MTSNAGRDPLRFKLSRLLLLLALVAAPVCSAPLGEMLVDLEPGYYTLGSDPIYLGTVGMEGAYKAMRNGYVDETWAREHHEYWWRESNTPTSCAKASSTSNKDVLHFSFQFSVCSFQ